MPANPETAFITKFRRQTDVVVHGFGEEVSSAHIRTFLVVAENEGKSVLELCELLGATRTTASRHLLDLSENLRSGDPGYGLLNRVRHPTDLRSVLFEVSPKGRRVLNSLRELMED